MFKENYDEIDNKTTIHVTSDRINVQRVGPGKVPFTNNKFYHNFLHYAMYLFSGYFFMSTVVGADEREAPTISVFMFLIHKLSDNCQLVFT